MKKRPVVRGYDRVCDRCSRPFKVCEIMYVAIVAIDQMLMKNMETRTEFVEDRVTYLCRKCREVKRRRRKMPKTAGNWPLMRKLDEEHQRLIDLSTRAGPRNGKIPVGGGDWMDCFFRAEAIRGTLTALRLGKKLSDAVADGKAVAEIAVQVWNGKREWQVHRSDCWIEDFIWSTVRRLC